MKKRRNTVAKQNILDLLISSGIALSHTEIQSILGDVCDRVTIYRILDQFVQDDIVHKVVGNNGVIKYAYCNHEKSVIKTKHDHVHFNCEVCEKVYCLDDIKPVFKLPRKFKVTDFNFLITGICPDCR